MQPHTAPQPVCCPLARAREMGVRDGGRAALHGRRPRLRRQAGPRPRKAAPRRKAGPPARKAALRIGVASALLFLATPDPAPAQAPGTGFRVDPALTAPIQAIAQGPDGRVWLASARGLLVYDGFSVERFVGAPGSAEEFPRGAVFSLTLDRRERLWVGHNRGLVRIDPARDVVERVYRHDPEDARSIPDTDVTSVLEDSRGRIWVGSLDWRTEARGGLSLLDADGTGFTRFPHDPTDPRSLSHNRVRSLAEDAEGRIWIATWHGLNRLRLDGTGFDRYLHDPNDPGSIAFDDVMALHRAADGTLWVATIGRGLDRYDPARDAFDHLGPSDGHLMALREDGRGRLWIGTLDAGLMVLEPGAERPVPVDRGAAEASRPRIDALTITADGVLWTSGLVADGAAGVVMRLDLDAPEFEVRRLGSARVLEAAGGGALWMGGGNLLTRLEPARGPAGGAEASVPRRTWECPGLGPPDPLHWLQSILRGPDGTLWLGYWDADLGLCRLDPGADLPRPVVAGGDGAFMPTWVSDLAWADGRLWVASRDGVAGIDPATGSVTPLPLSPDATGADPAAYVRVLAAGPAGELWLGTTEGRLLRRRPGGRLERFESVPGRRVEGFSAISSLRARPSGTVWVATNGYGLCEFDPAEDRCARTFRAADGLSSDYVMDVVESDGRIWVSTATAVGEVDLAEGVVRRVPIPSSLQEGRFYPASGTAASDGSVAFGTSSEVVGFRPSAAPDGTPPLTRITRVETVGSPDPVPVERDGDRVEALALPSDRNDLVFEYAGLHFADPASNRHQYRLDGHDDGWRGAGGERRARYTNLAPGVYAFRVRSASAAGTWGAAETFAFRILAPWWRQPWALFLWALLAAGAVVVARAVASRRRTMAEALAREQSEARRLQDLAAARSRLFANLSHEYRTPLSLILGQIDAARAAPADPDADGKLDMAGRQARELQRLTDQLLELSHLESGALELDWRGDDLVRLVRGCVAEFGSAAESAGVRLWADVPSAPLTARFDFTRMRQVLNNLLSNALKFTPAGGEVSVRLRAVGGPESSFAEIRVSDDGVGIPADEAEHVFDRFYQVARPEGSAAGGTGIGLALVREVLELHGATVTVDSEVGEGTRFTIRLPLETEAAPFLEGEPDGPEEDTIDAADAREIILVVDDHADLRAFLKQELDDRYRVEQAASAREGLAQAIDLIPDLVITDLVMPEMDGTGLVRELREDARTSHIPIIMLTGQATDDARVAGFQSGVDAYLAKPFNAEILRTRVANLLELRRLLRARYADSISLRPEEIDAPSVEKQFLAQVASVVEARIGDRSLSVPDLADAVAMSRSQLHRKLTALIGQSPGAVIRGMRLERAATLVRSGKALTAVAYETGFADQAHLGRNFKKHFGCTPTEFRETRDESTNVRDSRSIGGDARPVA